MHAVNAPSQFVGSENSLWPQLEKFFQLLKSMLEREQAAGLRSVLILNVKVEALPWNN